MGKVLVTYFSASGVTKKLAERLAAVISADVFEIKPAIPYTDEDLNWTNKKSRSSLEMNDRSSRPEISEKVDNMEKYDTVFVGFPIWWYREPSIIDTFMETYDFAGKTIIPFATSGSSGIGDSGKNMKELSKDANVVEGRRFSDSVKDDELKTWADNYLI